MTEEQLSSETGSAWYLPHHSVVHPQKPEKARMVFDWAAKFEGTSLNDQLMRGPDLTNSLVCVLTRFREETTAIMEIVTIYVFCGGQGDLHCPPEEFQMCVQIFSGVSSPSCASFALRKTVDDNENEFDKDTVTTVKRNFCVDDCLKSVESDSKAIKLVQQLRDLLSNGGFNLTKWISNSRDVIESIPEAARVSSIRELDFDHLPIEIVLEVHWNFESDVLGFKILVKVKPATRRGLLSVISAVYDPLVFLSPFLRKAKAILQDLSRKDLDWDDLIPPEDQERWRAWLEQLPTLQQFTVKRCLKPKNFGPVVSSQLHSFADASQQGCGAVSYLRITNKDDIVHCTFVMSESRLSPLKTVTIPRLGLSAAVVATRLSSMIQRELDMKIDNTFFWTNSTCVLSYLANQDKRFQTFVANRVATIHGGSQLSQWSMWTVIRIRPTTRLEGCLLKIS